MRKRSGPPRSFCLTVKEDHVILGVYEAGVERKYLALFGEDGPYVGDRIPPVFRGLRDWLNSIDGVFPVNEQGAPDIDEPST